MFHVEQFGIPAMENVPRAVRKRLFHVEQSKAGIWGRTICSTWNKLNVGQNLELFHVEQFRGLELLA